MPYKRKEDRQAAQRKRYNTNPEVKRKALEATKSWMQEHKEENNNYRARWVKEDRNTHREQYAAYEFAARLRKYHTTTEWYRDKLIEQNGLCAVCGHLSHFGDRIQSLSVDHMHNCCDTKAKSCGSCNRGLLCVLCNAKLAYLEMILKEATLVVPKWDTWLENALLYLTKYGRR